MYADNVCIYAKTRYISFSNLAIQKHLSETEGWVNIGINTEKTNCIIFIKNREAILTDLYAYETGINKRDIIWGRFSTIDSMEATLWPCSTHTVNRSPTIASPIKNKTCFLLSIGLHKTNSHSNSAFVSIKHMNKLQVLQENGLRIIGRYDRDTSILQWYKDNIGTLYKAYKFYSKTATNNNSPITQLD